MLLNSKSKKNILQNKKIKVSPTPNKIVFCIIFLIILPVCTFTTFSFIFSLFTYSELSPNPTSIPWIDNQSECLHTHRTWQDNKCWDDEHSSTF